MNPFLLSDIIKPKTFNFLLRTGYVNSVIRTLVRFAKSLAVHCKRVKCTAVQEIQNIDDYGFYLIKKDLISHIWKHNLSKTEGGMFNSYHL